MASRRPLESLNNNEKSLPVNTVSPFVPNPTVHNETNAINSTDENTLIQAGDASNNNQKVINLSIGNPRREPKSSLASDINNLISRSLNKTQETLSIIKKDFGPWVIQNGNSFRKTHVVIEPPGGRVFKTENMHKNPVPVPPSVQLEHLEKNVTTLASCKFQFDRTPPEPQFDCAPTNPQINPGSSNPQLNYAAPRPQFGPKQNRKITAIVAPKNVFEMSYLQWRSFAVKPVPKPPVFIRYIKYSLGLEIFWRADTDYMFSLPCAKIKEYELFGYIENQVHLHDHNLWVKICSLEADGPIMSYVVHRCEQYCAYHFIVRAMDIYRRFGPFSSHLSYYPL